MNVALGHRRNEQSSSQRRTDVRELETANVNRKTTKHEDVALGFRKISSITEIVSSLQPLAGGHLEHIGFLSGITNNIIASS